MQPAFVRSAPIGATRLKCRCFKASLVETGEGALKNLLHRSNCNAVCLCKRDRALLVDEEGPLRLNHKC